MPSARSILQLLQGAVEQLEKAAGEIRNVPLEPSTEHIHRIAAALTQISEVQFHVFALQPDLTPPWLAGPFENPDGAWELALGRSRKAESAGHDAMAIALLEWVAARVDSQEHRGRAQAEIARLRSKGAA